MKPSKILTFTLVLGLFVSMVSGPTASAGNLHAEVTFESGKVQPADSQVDGVSIRTLPEPQIDGEFVETGTGGAGPDEKWDTRVVRSEVVNGETINPRSGDYFMRSAIYYNKDYLSINGGGADKPRSAIGFTDPAHRFDFDEEVWLGFSLYIPMSWEHEYGVNHMGGSALLLGVNATAKRTLFSLNPRVPPGHEETRWLLMVQTDDSSTREGSSTEQIEYDLGSLTPDMGKWTDFVIRFRSNPFSSSTNPAAAGISGAMDREYDGNRGILQIWKSEGPIDSNGIRSMVKVLDMVNQPVGLVPHANDKLRIAFKLYKFGWKRNPTTVKGPVWVGFDEIRFGFTSQDGTGYDDVVPGMSTNIGIVPRPRPPELSIN